MEALARVTFPEIQAFSESEEGQRGLLSGKYSRNKAIRSRANEQGENILTDALTFALTLFFHNVLNVLDYFGVLTS